MDISGQHGEMTYHFVPKRGSTLVRNNYNNLQTVNDLRSEIVWKELFVLGVFHQFGDQPMLNEVCNHGIKDGKRFDCSLFWRRAMPWKMSPIHIICISCARVVELALAPFLEWLDSNI